MSKIITDGIVNLNGFRFVPRRPLRSAERRRKPSTFPKRRNLPNYLFNRLGIDNGPDRKITLGFGEITENRPTHRRSNCLILLRRRRTNCQPLVNARPAGKSRKRPTTWAGGGAPAEAQQTPKYVFAFCESIETRFFRFWCSQLAKSVNLHKKWAGVGGVNTADCSNELSFQVL